MIGQREVEGKNGPQNSEVLPQGRCIFRMRSFKMLLSFSCFFYSD